MTTNLGFSKDSIGFTESKNNIDIEEFLGVEFVNRIGKIYYFNDISSDVIRKIVEKRLDILIEGFKKKDLKITFSPKIVDKVIEESNYPKFGARRVDKVIDNIVTPIIVDAWYNGKKEITV